MADYREGLKKHQIPLYMHEGILRWIEHGIEPGEFLQSFLKNDLKRTFEKADDVNQSLILSYIRYFYNYAPGPCWGSFDNYQKWRLHKGLEGYETSGAGECLTCGKPRPVLSDQFMKPDFCHC